MKRVVGLVTVALVAAVVAVVVWVGLPTGGGPEEPADRFATINFVPPQVTEFTPAGWQKFRDDVAATLAALPSGASYREKNPAPELFVRQAMDKKKAVEAYRAVGPGERKEVFDKLAGQLSSRTRPGDTDPTLDQLVAEYETDFPGDGWGKFYKAQQLTRRGDPAGAEPVFAAAAALLPGEAKVRTAWSNCLLRLGRWQDAYEKAGRGRDEFLTIAGSLQAKEDAAALQGLVDLHRAADPDDPEAEYYRGWVYWLRGDYPTANRSWDEYLAGGPGRWIPPVEYDRWVRGLVRKNRLAEAKAFVEHTPRAAKGSDVAVWRVLLAAKAGDPAGAIRAIEQARTETPGFAWHTDRDLAPLLKTAGMAPVREKFPPPPAGA